MRVPKGIPTNDVTAVEVSTYMRPPFRCDRHYTHLQYHMAPSPRPFLSKIKSLLNNYKWYHTQENIMRFPLIGFLFLIKQVIHVNTEINIREISAMPWEKCITLKCNTVVKILKWIPNFKKVCWMNKTTIICPVFRSGSLSSSFEDLLKITCRKLKKLKLIRLTELFTWILRYVVMGTTRKQ
jgi:hypothetical protein